MNERVFVNAGQRFAVLGQVYAPNPTSYFFSTCGDTPQQQFKSFIKDKGVFLHGFAVNKNIGVAEARTSDIAAGLPRIGIVKINYKTNYVAAPSSGPSK